MLEDAFNEYWRIHVTTIRLDLLKRFIGFGLNYDHIFDLVKKSLSGKMLFSNIPMPSNFLSDDYLAALLQWELDFKSNIETTKNTILAKLEFNKQAILTNLLDGVRNLFFLNFSLMTHGMKKMRILF